MRTLIPICLLLSCGPCFTAPAAGGAFVETTESYRPADITRVT